jgi:GNAT superfamily N-acetyltransferase
VREPDLELIDLRERHDEELLAALYRELFLPNFPDPDEGEDPSIWAPLLWGEPDPSQPVLHALVAGRDLASPSGRDLRGLLLCEFYRRSSCGLLSYIAIVPTFRGRGLARWLLERAVETLRADARSGDQRLRAVFGEVHDPARVDPSQDAFDPTSRLEVMEKLGARLVPISYVQPELRPGLLRSDRLLLVAFPIDGPVRSLPAETVRDFLRDLYSALGVRDPEGDPDYTRMSGQLEPTVSLRAVRA